jgi:hypothetical protein
MQCKGRYTKEKKEIPFPTKSGYFTERRCGEIAAHDELCEGCVEKRKLVFVLKNQQSHYLGKIDEPYIENCWLFGSPRYLRFAELPGNSPTTKQISEAETAQRISRGGLEMKTKAVKESKEEAKKLGRPKKNGTVISPLVAREALAAPVGPLAPTSSADAQSSAPTTTPPVVEQKPKPAPKPKKVIKKTIPLAVATVAKAVEVAETPLEAIEVIKIQLVPKVIGDKSYWLDSSKDKVYEKTKDGSIGKYLGRYDSHEQTLVSFPDSDVE